MGPTRVKLRTPPRPHKKPTGKQAEELRKTIRSLEAAADWAEKQAAANPGSRGLGYAKAAAWRRDEAFWLKMQLHGHTPISNRKLSYL